MTARQHHGWAWVALAVALALHVADEALNDFLSFYNPFVRNTLFPTFTFDVWITGLIAAVLLLLALTPLVIRGARWPAIASYILGGFMILNALGHLGGSLAFRRWLPGVYSSPLLLLAAANLIFRASRRNSPL